MEVAVLLDSEGNQSHVVVRINGGPMGCVCDESIIPHYNFVRYRPIQSVLVTCGKCQSYVAMLNLRMQQRAEKRRLEREAEEAREREEGRGL